MASGCVLCPQCKTLLVVPAPNIFLRCGICSMLMSIGANGSQQEVKSVIFEDNVPRPSSTGSQSPPGTPTTLLRHTLPSSIPPRQSTAPFPQARPILAPQPSFSTAQIPLQARVPVNQPLPAPSIPLPGLRPFPVPTPLISPGHSFKSPAALPLAQPAIPEGPRDSQTLLVEATFPPGRAAQSGSALPAAAPLPEQLVPHAPGGFAAPLPIPQALEAVTKNRGSRDLGKPVQGLTEGRVVSGDETHSFGEEILGTEAGTRSHPLDTSAELGDTERQQRLSGGAQHLKGLTGNEENRASRAEASQPTSPIEGASHSPAGQKEDQPEPSITTESPVTRSPNSEALRPKSSHGTRSTLPPHSPEQAPEQPPSASSQPVSQQLSSEPPPQPLSSTLSISQPPHPSALEPLSSFRGVPDSTSQPSLARQASLPMQYQPPLGGVHPPSPSLTFTCGSCNNAQMLPPLPPGGDHMKCGTCGSVNEVQIRGGEAPPPSPPPQAFVSQPSMQPQYGQQQMSSPRSQGGGYVTPPSPPAQTMKCGACGSVMMLPPMEAGVHQFQCGACRAINSCQIQAPVQAPVIPPISRYPSTNSMGSGGSRSSGGSLKDKLKKNLKKHMELQKSGGNASAFFSRPGSAGQQRWPPQYGQPQGAAYAQHGAFQQGGYQQPLAQEQPAQAGYQQPPQMTYQQPAQQGYQQPAQQGYQQPGQLNYQQAPQPGYQIDLQQASQPSHQPVSEPAYVQDTQPGFQPNPQPVYQQPNQTPQLVYQQPTQTAQPVLQPAYQSAPAPASQQPAYSPVPPPQAVVYQPPMGSEMQQAPQAILSSPEESNPPGAGLEAYLDAQLKIAQSPPSAQKPETLPESLSNLSDGSSLAADVQVANPSHPSGPKPVTPAPEESAEPQVEPHSRKEQVRPLSSNPPTKPSTPDYPVMAVQPASPEYPPRAARLPSPDYPPQPAVASRFTAVPWSQPPVNSLPNPPQATAVATPQAGVYSQPKINPPPVLNPQPATDPQRLSSPQIVPAQVVGTAPPAFPPAPPVIPQPAVTAQPAYKAPGIYSLPSDASSLSSHSSTAYGFNHQAQPQWQPDPLEAPAAIWVNGQRLTEEVTEAAEVLAGPIERGGFYWYDPVAGFWGEYGKPCQGILSPGIPEFDFPLPPDAAGGTTGVFVNGRQLAARDLAMLRQRKFPTKIGKRYTLDIGGTLKEEETGKVVVELGKLAQSVEEAGVGKGMKKAQFAPPPAPVQPRPKPKFGGWL